MSWFADTASWALILGVLTPLLVSVVQQPQWSDQVRALMSLVASVIVGVGTVLANGGFNDASGALGIVALVLVSSNTAYKTLWKPLGVSPMIEAATSPGGTHKVTTLGDTPHHRDDMGAGEARIVLIAALVVLALVGLYFIAQRM